MKVLGKVALVTGGARGFGKAFSEALLRKGAKVCFADVNSTEGEKTLKDFKQKFGDGSAHFVTCDVTSDSQFRGLMEETKSKFKQVHIVVNNAGIMNENLWQKTLDIDLKGVMRGTYLAVEYMRKDKGGEGGLVVNIASTAGLVPVYFAPAYVAAKHGVVGFTRSWAHSPLADDYGISFACLCPAFSDTDMLRTMNDERPPVMYPERKEEIMQLVKTTGINSVEYVVDAFMQLVENEPNNGAVMSVDQMRGIRYKHRLDKSRL